MPATDDPLLKFTPTQSRRWNPRMLVLGGRSDHGSTSGQQSRLTQDPRHCAPGRFSIRMRSV